MKKLYWHKENDGAIFGLQYPTFRIYKNKPREWILVYARNPNVENRQFPCKSEHQAKILANKLIKL